jgi:hypothetical protein
MHIPRQPSADDRAGPVAPTWDGPARAVLPVAATPGAQVLRGRLEELVTELRALGYWQRLVQARTDLVVAGLLYGAPVPTTTERLAAGAEAHDAAAPEGVDVDRLLADLAPLGCSEAGPGEHLERLRRTTVRLAERRRHLLEEVAATELALQDAAVLAAERLTGAAALGQPQPTG